jgi:hypothetical protein
MGTVTNLGESLFASWAEEHDSATMSKNGAANFMNKL